MNKYKLVIKNISKSYDGRLQANDQISLTIHPGKITALLGHNGAGKSTLLNQMIGFTKPDQGEIFYGDTSLVTNRKQARQLISYMSQNYAPLEKLTIEQNLRMLGKIRGLQGQDLTAAVTSLLEALDIAEYHKRLGKDLSGGLKRLTSFAMTLIGAPDIILLDEPTNDVDPLRREKQWQLLHSLALKGHTVVIVTHNLLEVEKYADHYALFNHGKLLKTGSVQQINHQTTYQLSFRFQHPSVLTDFQDYTLINGEICQLELAEADLAVTLATLQTHLEKGHLTDLNLHEKQLSISDLYREELTQTHENPA